MTALEASLTLCKKPRSILQWRKVNGLTDSSHQFNPQSVTQQLVHVHGGTTMPPPPPRGGDAHLGGGGISTLSAATMERRGRVTLQSQRSVRYNENNAASKTRKGGCHVRRRDFSTDATP